MDSQWNIEALTRWDEVLSSRFVHTWESWYERASQCHAFHSPALASAWLDTYLPLRNLQPIFLIASCRSAMMFLPLVLWRESWKSGRRRSIVPVGHSDYDYHDPLVVGQAEPADWHSYWKEISEFLGTGKRFQWDRLMINGIHSPNVDGVMLTTAGSTTTCSYLVLGEYRSAEDYLNSLKKGVRKDFLRRTRRLEERGKVSYHVFGDNDLESALAELPEFLGRHAKRWPHAYRAPGFHENILRRALPAKMLRFSCLKLDGRPLAWNLNFLDCQALRYYMPVHVNGFRAYGPGNILRYFDIRDAIKNGTPVFDFLRGGEAYKKDWASHEAPLYRLHTHQQHFAGKVRRCFADHVTPTLRRVLRGPLSTAAKA